LVLLILKEIAFMKKGIIVAVVIFIMIGCQAQPSVTDNIYEVNNEVVDEAINEEDPLVKYALDNINIKFVSDNGYYWNWWDIRKYIEDDTVQKQVELMTAYIEIQDFEGLRDIILDVPDYNNYIKEIKINYIVPILMSEDNYEDALRIVQSKYIAEYKAGRFRFDTLYLERYLYINHNLEYAINLIDNLMNEFPDDDLSYVWFAITEKNFDDLYSKGICLPLEYGSEQYELLQFLIDNYPNDPFIDHAYYFIGEYEKVISDFPNSSIYDRALYAKAYEAYKDAVGEGFYYYDMSKEIDTEKIDNTTDYFFEFLEKYPSSEFAEDAVEKLLTLYTAHYRVSRDDHYYYDLINEIYNLPIQFVDYKNNLLDYITYLVRREYIYCDSYIGLDSESIERLNASYLDEEYRTRILTGLAHNAFNLDYFDEAVELFDIADYNYFNNWDKARVDTLFDLYNVMGMGDKDSLFDVAEILRSNDEYELSIVYYEKLEALDLSDEELSKVKMLKASSYREINDSENMLETYKYIVDNLNETNFADDALAEIGVYYLLYNMRDSEKARSIFRQVIEEYPDTNSVNNAYNWIAWSYLRDENYEAALIAYEELRDKFPLNRLGLNARLNIMKIEDILEE